MLIYNLQVACVGLNCIGYLIYHVLCYIEGDSEFVFDVCNQHH